VTLTSETMARREGDIPNYLSAVTIKDANSDADLDDIHIDELPNVFLRIVLQKITIDNSLVCFFGNSLTNFADSLDRVDSVLVADMDPHCTFTTYRSRFQSWTQDPILPFSPSEQLPDPREFCRDFAGGNQVPSDIWPWSLRTPPAVTSEAYETWRSLAVRRLISSFLIRFPNRTHNFATISLGRQIVLLLLMITIS